VYSDQVFTADVDESNVSGQVTVSYRPIKSINSFVTAATSYKPVGVNLGGLPTSNGEVMLDLAQIKPEHVTHFEGGVKTNPTKSSTLNFVFFHTSVTDYQTQVQSPEVGVNRGYLANAEEVRVLGAEVDGNIRMNKNLSFYGALAFTDGEYVTFTNAPVPLEETGGTAAFKDISGSRLPGISKWSGSVGGEILSNSIKLFGLDTKLLLAFDNFYRSDFSSSPSPSKYLNVDAYYLLNARLGFRATQGLSLYFWGRNILGKDYFEQLLPAGGNAGHYAAVLGDPRTYGVTIRYNY
jgi:iron complex outermembrane recepter protein